MNQFENKTQKAKDSCFIQRESYFNLRAGMIGIQPNKILINLDQ